MTQPGRGFAVVTGATGFIGWHVAEYLRAAGWRVRAVARPESRGGVPDGIERLAIPLCADGLRRACEGADVVFNLAGRTSAPSRRLFDRTNVDLTRAVAIAARDAGAHLVHVSSQAAAGPAPADRPRTEADLPAPCSAYGASKLAGEDAVTSTRSLSWTIIRPVAVYGPRDRGFFPLFRLAQLGVLPMMDDGPAAYQLVHVDELTAIIVRAASQTAARHGTFFVGHPQAHTTAAILAGLARTSQRRVRVLRVPRLALRAAALWGDVASTLGATLVFDRSKLRELSAGGFVCSMAQAQRVLDAQPAMDISEGFVSTAGWYRRHGWL